MVLGVVLVVLELVLAVVLVVEVEGKFLVGRSEGCRLSQTGSSSLAVAVRLPCLGCKASQTFLNPPKPSSTFPKKDIQRPLKGH